MKVFLSPELYNKFCLYKGKPNTTSRFYKTFFGSKHAKQFNYFESYVLNDLNLGNLKEKIIIHYLTCLNDVDKLFGYVDNINIVLVNGEIFSYILSITNNLERLNKNWLQNHIVIENHSFFESLLKLVEFKQKAKVVFVNDDIKLLCHEGNSSRKIDLRILKAIYENIECCQEESLKKLIRANVRDGMSLFQEEYLADVYELKKEQLSALKNIYNIYIPRPRENHIPFEDYKKMILKNELTKKIVDFYIENDNSNIL